MKKILAVFDFDNTIIDDNSDTAVISIIGRNNVPQEVKELHHREGWTCFMQGIFQLLHEKSTTESTIKELIENLPPVNKIHELIKEMKNTEHYDIIIISDSNSYFIKVYLEKHNLNGDVLAVFTNPAEFVQGMLKISPYHDQSHCKLSTRNLCKGQVLDEFVENQRGKDVIYNKIIYIGDGVNDFCPVLRLNNKDLICARSKFRLHELLLKAKTGKSFDNSGKPHNIKAEMVVWESGDDILMKIKK